MITKAKGIDIILNFLSGESFQAAFCIIAVFGNFFHFSKSDMKNQRHLGKLIIILRIIQYNSTIYFTVHYTVSLLYTLLITLLALLNNQYNS